MISHPYRSLAVTAALLVAAAACSRGGGSAGSQARQSAAPSDTGPVFDVSLLDTTVSACTDFNGFVNLKWIKANPIPADRSSWGAFAELGEKSLDEQHQIVEAADQKADQAESGSIEQKIGWLYRSGMDTAAIDRAGYDPIKPALASIEALKSSKDLVSWLDDAYAKGQGQLFRFGARADYHDARTQIGYAFQGGLGLPTPDYYTKAEYEDIRDAYVEHIAKMLELTGVSADQASKEAGEVMAFETDLARHSLSRVELRKPANQYHFVSVAEANKVTPHFDWGAFFKAQGVDPGKGFSLSQPKFFAGFDSLLADAPIGQWKAYLAFHTIDAAAPYLSTPFQAEDFAFSGTTLRGQPQQQPRWKRVLGTVNRSMGMGLGQLYVARYFPPEAKARAQQLVTNVRDALKARIENLDWMSEATKTRALEKWQKFLPKIGYPDKWRDWSGLEVKPDDYFANVVAARKFNYDYNIKKIGQPTDRHEWGMTPQTVNAYYSPTTNTINFPAAILQPPFFYAHGDDAVNYGGIGAVIGHESSHGFDDQGSQFDGNGNNENWWTKADRKKFDARTARLVKQFDGYVPLKDHPDTHVNGQLTLGENIADLGGLNVAYDALQAALEKNPAEASKKIQGYTEDQRFFLAWARVWRGETREKAELVSLNTNPHSPAKFRAIGAPSDMPAFAEAFSCKAGDPMVRSGEEQVKIW
ncbi:MAG: M13-type metalloendopeptidase [Candidatus Palauibacterales bacterium]|nr:M13-type metalloendopeptidase [Candidatus Palauibacterales bacterium]MDP2528826.1 M13-type metalloendopeptidase [Candidatus Palauibacterales bacterium]